MRITMRAAVILAGTVLVFAAPPASAQPANDDCANATVIGSLPFTETVDTSTATNDGDTSPETPSCSNRENSIWYQYTAGASDVILVVDAYEGSAFVSTKIQAYTGSCGALDAGPVSYSHATSVSSAMNLAYRLPAGTSVRICIGSTSLTPSGGPIQVHVFEAPDFEIDPTGYRAEIDQRAVGGGPGGNFFVTWSSYDTSYEHRGRLFDASGTPAGPQVVLDTGYIRDYFDVAARASDGFVVVWQDTADDVRTQRIDAAGLPIGSSFAVNQNPAYYGGRLDTDADGDFVVVWIGGSQSVRFRLFDSAGTALGPEQVVAGASSNYQPDVARDDAGNFVVVWETGADHIAAQRFDSSGAPLGTMVTVTENDSLTPAVAAAPTGEFFVTWFQFDSAFQRGVYGQAYGADGTPEGPPFLLSNPDANATDHRPSIASDDAGNFVVAWEDDGGRADVDRNIEATARRIGPGGVTLGPEFLVNTVDQGDQYWPAVGVAPDGRFMVAWGDNSGYFPWSIPYAQAHVGRTFASDAFLECPGRASTTCRGSILPGKSKLLLRNDGTDPADLAINWKLVRAEATAATDYGDPLTSDDLFFCLYNDTGGSAGGALVTQAALPASGLCAGKPCWKGLGEPAGAKGFKYKDRERTPNGVLKAVLKAGAEGKSQIVFKAGRGNLATGPAGGPPSIPIIGSLTAQLHAPATGTCWGATFQAATAKRNSGGIFQASAD